ncbi:hypothetical protein [Archaeoglobus neptunius]|uniref:hypothetical protein n=1 Tax=Archaeoglobus neptunius TaxID=2798580 RepID=UPI0019265198|nr:hypothetical protein [Archaeoglobus neptunius]
MVKTRIHTTISQETFRKIEELKKEYKTLSNIIERAVDILYNSAYTASVGEEDILLLNFVRDLNFTLCAKDHYTALAEGDTERAVKESMIEMAVKYISKKPISDLSFEELLDNVCKLWKLLNRAEHVEVERLGGRINFVFYHDMRSIRVSEIHLNLLKLLFEKYYSDKYDMDVETVTVNGFSVVFSRK